jgi:hypothetical protein
MKDSRLPPAFCSSLCAILLSLTSLTAGISRAEASPPQISGWWIADLGELRYAARCGDGKHIWAIGPGGNGLCRIDGATAEVAPNQMLLMSTQIQGVLPIAGATKAWIETPAGLYLADYISCKVVSTSRW